MSSSFNRSFRTGLGDVGEGDEEPNGLGVAVNQPASVDHQTPIFLPLAREVDLVGGDVRGARRGRLEKRGELGQAPFAQTDLRKPAPATPLGSTSNTRQKEALAAMIVRSPARNSKGSLDASTIASEVAASLNVRLSSVMLFAFAALRRPPSDRSGEYWERRSGNLFFSREASQYSIAGVGSAPACVHEIIGGVRRLGMFNAIRYWGDRVGNYALPATPFTPPDLQRIRKGPQPSRRSRPCGAPRAARPGATLRWRRPRWRRWRPRKHSCLLRARRRARR